MTVKVGERKLWRLEAQLGHSWMGKLDSTFACNQSCLANAQSNQ